MPNLRKLLIFGMILAMLVVVPVASAITLAWDSYTDVADGFRIYESTDGINFSLISGFGNIPTSHVSATIPDGALGTKVYYYLTAFDSANESDPSGVVSYNFYSGGGGGEIPNNPTGITFIDCTQTENINLPVCTGAYK